MYSRRGRLALAWTFCLLPELVYTETSRYSACQAPTSNPLDGCPANTILVSQSDCAASFNTIQSAISSIPDNTTPYNILVLPGNYVEQLNVTRSGPLTILGQTSTPNEQSDNTVTVYWAAANSNSRYTDNAFTSVLTVAPNLNSSLTGSGPTGFPVPSDSMYYSTRSSPERRFGPDSVIYSSFRLHRLPCLQHRLQERVLGDQRRTKLSSERKQSKCWVLLFRLLQLSGHCVYRKAWKRVLLSQRDCRTDRFLLW